MNIHNLSKCLMAVILALAGIMTSGCLYGESDDDMNQHVVQGPNGLQGKPISGWGVTNPLTTGPLTFPNRYITGGNEKVHLQANLERDDSVTTQFFVSDTRVRPVATITSSVNGNSITRRVSVINGASITTRGKTIDVDVKDYTAAGLALNNVSYSVSILATVGVRGSTKMPPLLNPLVFKDNAGVIQPIIGMITIPSGQLATIPVPADAGVTSVFVTAIADDTTKIATEDQLRVLQKIAGTTVRAYDPRTWNDWVPLEASTDVIEIDNISTGQYEFAVTFGVDG